MKYMDKRNIWRLRFELVLFIIIAIVVADFVIDSLIPVHSTAFIARLFPSRLFAGMDLMLRDMQLDLRVIVSPSVLCVAKSEFN